MSGKKAPVVEGFREKQGVFVTLLTHPGHDLRGCIGFPEPVLPLGEALVQAAVSAALDDPRFQPVDKDELEGLVVEISVLSQPKQMECPPSSRCRHVKIGRDGLIARRYRNGGLLLPQVPVEWGWDSSTFLGQTCVKAGLSPDCWKDAKTDFYTFQAEVFCEQSPGGKAVKKKM